MLGKLIKYEWKSTYKVGCLLLGIVAAVSLLEWMVMGSRTSLWELIDSGSRTGVDEQVGNILWSIIGIFTFVVYVMMLVGVNYGIFIYLGVRFYKTMYTKEGYLLHTLPVTKHQILGSKILVGGLWMMILVIWVSLSVFIFGYTLINLFLPSGYTIGEVWRELGLSMSDLLSMLEDELGWNLVSWLFSLLIMVLIGPFSTVIILFGAISMGQLFTKARVFMAIACYIGIWVLGALISSVIQSIFSVFSYTFGNYVNFSSYAGTVKDILIAVGLYFVSYYVINNKLNME